MDSVLGPADFWRWIAICFTWEHQILSNVYFWLFYRLLRYFWRNWNVKNGQSWKKGEKKAHKTQKNVILLYSVAHSAWKNFRHPQTILPQPPPPPILLIVLQKPREFNKMLSLVGCLNGLNARRFDFSEFKVSCLGTLQLPYGGPPRSWRARERSPIPKKMWYSAHPRNFGNHATVCPPARPTVRPSARTTGKLI